MENIMLEGEQEKYSDVYYDRLRLAIQLALGKSDITEDLCGKIGELYKISEILLSNKSQNHSGFLNLFYLNYYQLLETISKKQKEILSYDESKLKVYNEKINLYLDQMILKYPEQKSWGEIKQTVQTKLSNDLLRQCLIDYFLRYGSQYSDYNAEFLARAINGLTDEDKNNCKALDVDGEINRLSEIFTYTDKQRPLINKSNILLNLQQLEKDGLGYGSEAIIDPIRKVLSGFPSLEMKHRQM